MEVVTESRTIRFRMSQDELRQMVADKTGTTIIQVGPLEVSQAEDGSVFLDGCWHTA